MYSDNTVDVAVDRFANLTVQATDLAIHRYVIRKSRFTHWLSHIWIKYIWIKNYYSKFSHYRKLVKITNKSDRLNWYKIIEDDLKTQPIKFWMKKSSFTKHNSYIIHLDVNDTDVVNLLKPTGHVMNQQV